ncbi:MAG: PAS domain S-box protein [Magnetococcales bacterium]|nr:PAS domain S-box protein [Magnetococcales bacterium]
MNSQEQSLSWFQSRLLGVGSIWLVACTGIALSLATYWVTSHQLQIHKRLDFEWAGQNRHRAFQKEVGDKLATLGKLRTLLMGLPKLSQKRFAVSATAIMSGHGAIMALAWVPRDGSGIEDGYIKSSPEYAEYLNLKQMPDIKPFLRADADEDDMTARVLQIGNRQNPATLFAVFLPTYFKKFDPSAKVEKTKKPQGFVVGIFRLDRMLTTSLDPLEPRGIDIWLNEPEIPGQSGILSHYASRLRQNQHSPTVDHNTTDKNLKLVTTVQVADRSWTFTALANPMFRSAQAFNEGPWILLVEGILFTVVLVLYLMRMQNEIKKRIKIASALQESEERLRNLLDHSPDIIITLDDNGKILFMNQPFPKSSTSQKVGSGFIELLPKSLQNKHKIAIDKVFNDHTVENLRFSLPDLSWWEARLIPIKQHQKVAKVMLIISDVTQTHLLHAQAVRNARLASLGVLAASVAHEINNPNSAIHFNNSILKRTWGDILSVLRRYSENIDQFSLGGMPAEEAIEAIPRLMDGIERSTKRIKKIVGNLKHMARQDKGGMEQNVNISDVIQAAISILQNQIKKYTDFCLLNAGDDLPLIRGNAQQLEQVIINVLLNALQSLPDRSRRIHLSTTVDKTGENILIQIQDEGVGIAEDILKNITDPFFTTKETSGGTGLGLSISSDIISNHGGKIFFDSKVDEGTMVTIKLPTIPSALVSLQT